MFEPSSRYYHIPDAVHRDEDGTEHHYKRRRLLPQGDSLPTLALLRTQSHDRLDLLALRAAGSVELYWRLCDANNALNPFDLLEQPGITLRVPQPSANP